MLALFLNYLPGSLNHKLMLIHLLIRCFPGKLKLLYEQDHQRTYIFIRL